MTMIGVNCSTKEFCRDEISDRDIAAALERAVRQLYDDVSLQNWRIEMSLAMNKTEREAFLADLHVGVVSMNRQHEGPLSAPIWYIYEDGQVWFSTGADSLKGRLMNVGERISLVAQTEQPPYMYVSVEGPIVAREEMDVDRDIRPMAIRYLGEEMGNDYADGSGGGNSVVIRMKPEKWLTVDYNKSS